MPSVSASHSLQADPSFASQVILREPFGRRLRTQRHRIIRVDLGYHHRPASSRGRADLGNFHAATVIGLPGLP
jgi:hypothetical protein